jgi:hypothetical protein
MNRDFQSGSRAHLIELENFRKLQKNRVKTSRLLWRKMPSKVEFGRSLRWVLPLRPYPFFRRLAPWPFGSVAGAQNHARSRYSYKNIAFRAYSKWYGSTVRRCADTSPWPGIENVASAEENSKAIRVSYDSVRRASRQVTRTRTLLKAVIG